MKIYISGPMSHLPDSNYPAFHAAAAKLSERGHAISNPADFHRDNQDLSYPDLMRHCIRELLTCQRLVLLPGWENSRGARVEHLIATVLEMPVEHYPTT